MNKMMKSLMIAGVVGLCALMAQAERIVEYEWEISGSVSVGKTMQVTIPEEGEVYYKVSGLTAGQPYTFLATGDGDSGALVEAIYVSSESDDEGTTYVFDTYFGETTSDLKTPDQMRCIIYETTWEDEYIVVTDPEDLDWKVRPIGYYLHIMGEVGETITITSMKGAVEEPIPVGEPANPKFLEPQATPMTYEANMLEDLGSYSFASDVATGNTYLFATTGGTAEMPITLDFSREDDFQIRKISGDLVPTGNVVCVLTSEKAIELGYMLNGEPGARFGLTTQCSTNGILGRVTVQTRGANAKWAFKGATDWHANGETVMFLGDQTIVFESLPGMTTPDEQLVSPERFNEAISVVGVYTDVFDPGDDTVAGAVTIKSTVKVAQEKRTLFAADVDHFAFSAEDGVCYNFSLKDLVGDAKMVVFKANDPGATPLKGPTERIFAFAPGEGDYIIRVFKDSSEDASYVLEHSCAEVCTVTFAKTEVKAKKTAGSVSLSVKRSSSEGKIRVLYGTVNGTAKPGIDYVAQNGELVWEDGDKKAKTITIKLLPELFAAEAVSRQFKVQLKPVDGENLPSGEYPGAILSGKDIAEVTVTETKGKPEKEIKKATTKTEDVPLEIGTYQGVLVETSSKLTNGFPALASVTFTAKNAAKKALSAKVTVAGKSYSYAADAWDAAESDAETAVAVMTLQQKIGKVVYESSLRVTVKRGATATEGDWANANARAELVINIPDAKGKGLQRDIRYAGSLFRDNSKIQGYLDAVLDVAGYYTVALVSQDAGIDDGIPAGNGYLTLTIDAKGKAKIAGLLADGSTKPTYSSIVSIGEDGVVQIPVFVAKSPSCFGGKLKLIRGEGGRYFVDSSNLLIWNNDNAALTRDGEEGWSLEVEPVGGYFNTVNNLQTSYLTSAFLVDTVALQDVPDEILTAGLSFVEGTEPQGFSLDVAGNAFAVEKKAIVKNGKVVDLENSVNPCNVQVKLARATGLVSGSFSLWTKDAKGTLKEKSGFKHNGILILSRDADTSLDPRVMSAGFFTQKATVLDELPTGKTKKRTYTVSMPFNILAIDQGVPDWYADDWGEPEN